ncbi:MAG TPA: methionyl-tRNA formyltransferase [Anditalea sp.]|nr:methionyl-tRNA formyltransferase [Anditalea sp.]
MKILFLGCTAFSERLLIKLSNLENIEIGAVFSIPQEFQISYSKEKVKNSNYVNLKPYADKLNIPFFEVESVEGKKLTDYKEFIENYQPDAILVMGWYYMVPKSIRDLAKMGAWGIHASLLPKYAGGAPLVWAIIEGEKETGVSLFQLSDGVDDGDLISQKSFPITNTDTIKEVYEKATIASENILDEIFRFPQDIIFKPQDKSKIQVYPQRKPEDGEIDLSWPAERIYNFIRAQSAPYPGAFIKSSDNKKIYIESARYRNDT